MVLTGNEKGEEVWFLDSGCSNHMCGDKSWFSTFDEEFRHSVKLGNNYQLKVIGKGNMSVQVNGRQFTITDVFHVPDLKTNLFSIGQLLEKECEVLMKQGVCKLYHPNLGLIMESKMTTNRLFKIMATKNSMKATTKCLQAATADEF